VTLCLCAEILHGLEIKKKMKRALSILCASFLFLTIANAQPPVSKVYPSTARQKSAIDTVYPFDISMRTIQGDTVLSNKVLPQNDKPTVLFFWMTTCYPCRMELTSMRSVYDSLQTITPFNMVAISTDFPDRYPQVVERATTETWPWQTYYDLNREFIQIMPGGLNGLPQVFLLNTQGQVVFHKRKYNTGDEQLIFEAIQKVGAK
jgi:cytochrome c biogenesis protein CcmG, thiol:disulfide interchange protein DsbE